MAGVPAVVTTAAPDASGYDGLARWSRRLSHLALPSSETDAQGGSLVDAYQEVLLRRGLARRRVDLVGLRSVTLRRARTADVPAIARMHVEVLSSGSLQLLGEPFLRELFRAQVLDPDAVVVVADREGEVIGYSSGVVSTSAFRRRFATRHGIRAGIVALPRLLDRDVARKLFETARYPDTTRDLPDAEHLFLGVRRGTAPGLGAVLTREVIDVLGRRGAEEVKGFVSAENGPMLLMLRRVGFEVRGELSLHDGHPSYVVVIRCPTPSPSSSAAS
jgi:ribosomal protein S18 acetylase RimI-like enzyme